MSSRIRFSVIVPVYNGEKTLARAIDSILSQCYPAYEIIVVDDGSLDKSALIAQGYGSQINLLQQDNLGVSSARNRGAESATGDWLTFLDADDWYYPSRLQAHAQLIDQNMGFDLLSGNFHYVYDDGSKKENIDSLNWVSHLKAKEQDGVVVIDKFLRKLYAGQHVGDTHTISISKDLFCRVGGYPIGIAIAEDMHFLLRALDSSKAQAVSLAPLAAYRVLDNSAIRSNRLNSQQLAVNAYRKLLGEYSFQRNEVKTGAQEALRLARLDYSYALLKSNRQYSAVVNQLSALWQDECSIVKRGRDFLSILRGV
ncbi:glycosyltransferase family 2 protein [Aestuariirhabdus sp. Z084]|uniref:glycosyltransferase family 2 protein n=1 Tax=Aestuariirhabdus haliotis TaxID=2918751 RepID=UPI00201B4595|nr:glycosyltransferase family A protein [Aestuariirhabdus haliotis]MCL6416877.1 glycosyltransferase family 2 protein [Aestuariirhabdus haliotis]MCL6420904.1 glycosyltransferase family 2 protein [Aestuariirhabdus haliotis]